MYLLFVIFGNHIESVSVSVFVHLICTRIIFSHNNCFCICICNLYLHLCIILWKLFQAFQTQRLFSPVFLLVPSPFTGSIYWPPTSRRVNTSPLISKQFQAFAKPGIWPEFSQLHWTFTFWQVGGQDVWWAKIIWKLYGQLAASPIVL